MSYIISDNKLIPIDEFHFQSEDGLLYGYGIFETLLVKKRRAIFMREHYDRLMKGLNVLKINCNISYEEFKNNINIYIEKIGLTHFVLRVTVLKNKDEFDMLITHRENSYTSTHYKEGFKMEISGFKRNPSSLLSNIKSVNYLENIFALRQAKSVGSDEVLFLDTKNYVSEGATSNIFFIKEGVIYTPTKECGLLEGIIREKVIDMIKHNRHLEMKQGFFSLKSLLEADEVFLTNSVMGIMPVVKIDHKTYNLKRYYITDMLRRELNTKEDSSL